MNTIFNMYKIRFNTLTRLINESNINIKDTDTVNIFINLESILDTLANARTENYLAIRPEDKIFEFISNILNLAAHYRLFFSKNRIFSKIYLYMTYPFTIYYKNSNILEDYRSYYTTKFSMNTNNASTHEVIVHSLKHLKIITEYIQNVYIIESGEIEASLIPLIAQEENINQVNFIVSKDLYDYQFVNKDFYILRPKKDDKAYIVNKKNLINTLQIESKSKEFIELDPEYIGFILSVLGDTKRNIPKIKKIGIPRITKSINNAINNKTLPKGVYNIHLIASLLKDEDRKTLLSNYYCTDIDTQYKLINKKNIYEIKDQMKDKFDNAALKQLNDAYFINHPINLVELTSGDKFKYHKKQDIF